MTKFRPPGWHRCARGRPCVGHGCCQMQLVGMSEGKRGGLSQLWKAGRHQGLQEPRRPPRPPSNPRSLWTRLEPPGHLSSEDGEGTHRLSCLQALPPFALLRAHLWALHSWDSTALEKRGTPQTPKPPPTHLQWRPRHHQQAQEQIAAFVAQGLFGTKPRCAWGAPLHALSRGSPQERSLGSTLRIFFFRTD